MNRALVLLLGAIIVVSGCAATPTKDYRAFTTCVKQSGIIEYGAYWCPNCAKVKLTLGDEAWSNLAYVECDPKCTGNPLPEFCKGFASQTQKCLDIGVNKYPSWVRNDQILYAGTDLAKVAELSGCALPA